MKDKNNKLMTTEELAEYLRVDRVSVYRYLKDGEIPALRVGGRWRFKKDDIDEWLTVQAKEVSNPKEILVVDDEESVRNLLRDILVQNGYNVSLAANAEEALESLTSRAYALAIVDLKLPKMSGMELIYEIREQHEELPIVIITGYSTEEAAVEAVKLGVDDYVKKPFDNMEDFIQKVKQLTESNTRL